MYYNNIAHVVIPPSLKGTCNVDRASQPNDAMNIIGSTAYGVIIIYIIVIKNTCYTMKNSTLYTARTFCDV
jgi:hypothetical protein